MFQKYATVTREFFQHILIKKEIKDKTISDYFNLFEINYNNDEKNRIRIVLVYNLR